MAGKIPFGKHLSRSAILTRVQERKKDPQNLLSQGPPLLLFGADAPKRSKNQHSLFLKVTFSKLFQLCRNTSVDNMMKKSR